MYLVAIVNAMEQLFVPYQTNILCEMGMPFKYQTLLTQFDLLKWIAIEKKAYPLYPHYKA